MPPKKKKAGGGDAAKGEKIFKNLCSACHSLSVSDSSNLDSIRPTQQAPPSAVSAVKTSLQDKGSTTHRPWLLRPPSSGLTETWTNGLSLLLTSRLATPWPLQELQVPKTARIWLPS